MGDENILKPTIQEEVNFGLTEGMGRMYREELDKRFKGSEAQKFKSSRTQVIYTRTFLRQFGKHSHHNDSRSVSQGLL